ncbi:hypothetical protein CFC21_104988 [Triticum aestivum]|uniref:phosphoglycerate kinase n=2 Tax=Triticum aestivum TaxID=4565 RepID=A0A9R1MBE0_WHEAT|nr:hypothetical protein CFC21_104988 [Triticum aestivum]
MATKRSVGTPGPQGPQEQNVFLRADLNILLDDDRNITEDNRIRASVPSVPFLKFLMGKATKVILANNLWLLPLATPHLPARSPLAVGPCPPASPVVHGARPGSVCPPPSCCSLVAPIIQPLVWRTAVCLYLLDVGSNTTGWPCRAFISDLTDLGL